MQRSKNMKIAIMWFYFSTFFAFVGFYADIPPLGITSSFAGIVAFGIYIYLARKAMKSGFSDSK